MNELSSSGSPMCEESTHTFILRSVAGSQRAIEDVELVLPRGAAGSAQGGLVVFNCDRKPHTPAFVGAGQQAELGALDLDFRTIFESRVRRSSGLLLADPRTARSAQTPYCLSPSSDYCLICHETFSNYFKHINHPVHLKKISASVGQEYIAELVQRVRLDSERAQRAHRAIAKPRRRRRTDNVGVRLEERRLSHHNFQSTSPVREGSA